MKCPLIRQGAIEHDKQIGTEQAECGMELCAWYDTDANRCAIWLISLQLYHLNGILSSISKAMLDKE